MSHKKIVSAALMFLLLLSTASFAMQSSCPGHYLFGVAPDIVNPNKAVKARELCSSYFGVVHSGITRTPLWSAEHLTAENVEHAKGQSRTNDFHPDDRLPASERSELKDFSRSGYDRGHLTPNGDEPNFPAKTESFALSNMVPQAPKCNRGVWEELEVSVRTLALHRGDLYVITGPLFLGESLKQLNGRVYVPTHIFKVVYDPKKRKGAVYLVENTDETGYSVISIAELEQYAEINFFPNLSAAEKSAMLDLPAPTPHGHGSHKSGAGQSSMLRSMLRSFLR